jgi:hypothetical protein
VGAVQTLEEDKMAVEVEETTVQVVVLVLTEFKMVMKLA